MALDVELGMRPLVADCRFSLGKLYRRSGKRRATENLTTAMSLFQDMGMRFWFEKADAEMQALEGHRGPRSTFSPPLAVDSAESPP